MWGDKKTRMVISEGNFVPPKYTVVPSLELLRAESTCKYSGCWLPLRGTRRFRQSPTITFTHGSSNESRGFPRLDWTILIQQRNLSDFRVSTVVDLIRRNVCKLCIRRERGKMNPRP